MAGLGGEQQQEEASAAPLHLVVFPWLAFGHLIPFLELSKRLAARGHAVTFLSTPRNVARLPPVPDGLSGRDRFVALPLPAVDGLPEGAESTADVPPEKVELLKVAFDGLASPFADFLAAACAGASDGDDRSREQEAGLFGRKPDWVVLDFAHYWACPIVEQHQVVCAMFGIFTATLAAHFGTPEENTNNPRVTAEDFMPMPRWFPASTPSSLAFRRHEAAWLAAASQPNASGVGDGERFWRTMPHCRLYSLRSCPEMEPQMFPLLAELHSIPVVPAGLLLPDDRRVDGDDHDSSATMARSAALQWLDEQPSRSVIYVALGSEAPVTAEGVHELALGLEFSGARFLWALRLPSGATDAGASPALPDGFEMRTRGRGAVCTSWVPQMQVLAHAAVGAFLTHCGWGSVIENLRFGHPLVMLPFIVDQGLIARMMAERGIGVEMDRRDDGWFGRDDVAAAVRRVMVEEEGKKLALNARMLHEVVVGDDGGRRQERYVDELVDCLQAELHRGY